MDELLKMLSDAVASQNWLTVAAVSVVLVAGLASVVLKALKKPVPILDTLLDLAAYSLLAIVLFDEGAK